MKYDPTDLQMSCKAFVVTGFHNWVYDLVRSVKQCQSCNVLYDYGTVSSCCGGKGTQVYTTKQGWHCTDCGTPSSKTPPAVGSIYTPANVFGLDDLKAKKCTCGSSAVGSDRHSDYCDKYEGNK